MTNSTKPSAQPVNAPERIFVWTEGPREYHDTRTADSDVEYIRFDLAQEGAQSTQQAYDKLRADLVTAPVVDQDREALAQSLQEVVNMIQYAHDAGLGGSISLTCPTMLKAKGLLAQFPVTGGQLATPSDVDTLLFRLAGKDCELLVATNSDCPDELPFAQWCVVCQARGLLQKYARDPRVTGEKRCVKCQGYREQIKRLTNRVRTLVAEGDI